MPTKRQEQAAPSAAELESATAISQAGVAAAAEAPEAERVPAAASAMREAAEAQGIKISEDDANMIASAVVSQIEARGGFDPPPAPPAPEAPPPPAEADAPTPVVPVAPPRKTFAEKFSGR